MNVCVPRECSKSCLGLCTRMLSEPQNNLTSGEGEYLQCSFQLLSIPSSKVDVSSALKPRRQRLAKLCVRSVEFAYGHVKLCLRSLGARPHLNGTPAVRPPREYFMVLHGFLVYMAETEHNGLEICECGDACLRLLARESSPEGEHILCPGKCVDGGS